MVGELLRFHRRRAGLTQEQLAAVAGISARSVRGIESGRVRAPRQSTVHLLAEALRLTGADLDRFRAAAAGARPWSSLPVPAPPGVGRLVPRPALTPVAVQVGDGAARTGFYLHLRVPAVGREFRLGPFPLTAAGSPAAGPTAVIEYAVVVERPAAGSRAPAGPDRIPVRRGLTRPAS